MARTLVIALVTARGLTELTRVLPQALRRPWERTNHAGRTVTLLEGPTAVGATLAGVLAGPAPRGAAVLAVLVPGVLGGLDDLVGDPTTKGLRGHLGALRSGRVTTGVLKIGGLGGVAVVTALMEMASVATAPETKGAGTPSLRHAAVDSVVIAGTANLVNLLDLRPGRALKVTTAAGFALLLPAHSRPVAGALVGVAAVLPEDLAGESMLGDCGANALGALLGLALVRGLTPGGRLTAAAIVTGLTLVSERVSFTRVIESTPVLREIDAWGRDR
ncbi:hypothetical protein ASG73_13195 [Janibacter sp. Soil728]|uniref:hypothetical protein n=1 Tax=Janibacter sp. Soil728 TaxID=1736393 RepID=UPI0006FA34B0|nr:hypothetical protein [Janibacter sp. Soil728]KRE37293.1 hypothetical protein ASG73_13195 [Janibacter sp. Soil728]